MNQMNEIEVNNNISLTDDEYNILKVYCSNNKSCIDITFNELNELIPSYINRFDEDSKKVLIENKNMTIKDYINSLSCCNNYDDDDDINEILKKIK